MHENAAGISINDPGALLDDMNDILSSMNTEPVYRVDYIFNNTPTEDDAKKIIDIAKMNDYWGQDIDRAEVAIRFKITSDNFSVMKSNTLKITLPNVSLIMFGGTDEDIENFTTSGWIEVEAVCRCNANNWMGNENAQLIIQNYKIIDSCKYMF